MMRSACRAPPLTLPLILFNQLYQLKRAALANKGRCIFLWKG